MDPEYAILQPKTNRTDFLFEIIILAYERNFFNLIGDFAYTLNEEKK